MHYLPALWYVAVGMAVLMWTFNEPGMQLIPAFGGGVLIGAGINQVFDL